MRLFSRPSRIDGGIATYAKGVKRTAMDARYDLITPVGLRRVANACHEGAVKYAAFNCERGLPVSVYLNHALKHIYQYLSGDRSEDHLGHAAWNLLFACHSEELTPELNTDLRKPGCLPPDAATAADAEPPPPSPAAQPTPMQLFGGQR